MNAAAPKDENSNDILKIEDVSIPDISSPPGTIQAALETLHAQLKAYEDNILTLTAQRNAINARIKHRKAQAQAIEESLRKLEKQLGIRPEQK